MSCPVTLVQDFTFYTTLSNMFRKDYKIYLSSTTYKWWNFGSFNWKKKLISKVRRSFKDKAMMKFLDERICWCDPLSFKSEDPIVYKRDIKDINESQMVVVYIDKLSIGTLLELGYCCFNCFEQPKDVIVVARNKYVSNHPWIVALCRDFTVYNLDDCAELIHDKVIKWWLEQ